MVSDRTPGYSETEESLANSPLRTAYSCNVHAINIIVISTDPDDLQGTPAMSSLISYITLPARLNLDFNLVKNLKKWKLVRDLYETVPTRRPNVTTFE